MAFDKRHFHGGGFTNKHTPHPTYAAIALRNTDDMDELAMQFLGKLRKVRRSPMGWWTGGVTEGQNRPNWYFLGDGAWPPCGFVLFENANLLGVHWGSGNLGQVCWQRSEEHVTVFAAGFLRQSAILLPSCPQVIGKDKNVQNWQVYQDLKSDLETFRNMRLGWIHLAQK